jgi:TPR repeat protein
VNGQGVSANLTESAKYFKLAADQGHAEAQFRSGFFLADGRGVSTDFTESTRYMGQ